MGVFGLLPVALIALALVLPSVHQTAGPGTEAASRRPAVIPAAAGAVLGTAALSFAAQRPGVLSGALAIVALSMLVPSLRRLLPAGVFRARRGIPAVVTCRGLAAALFYTTNSYLPLILTSTHHWSLAAAGSPPLLGSLGWSAASAWQGRKPELARPVLLRVGFVLLAVSVLGLLLVAPGWGVAWLALLVWTVAGLGMGLVYPSISFLLLGQSEARDRGFHTSAAQLTEQLSAASLIGFGGALLAICPLYQPGAAPAATAMPILLTVLAVLGLTGALIAPRTAA